jgi:hypothetical protein
VATLVWWPGLASFAISGRRLIDFSLSRHRCAGLGTGIHLNLLEKAILCLTIGLTAAVLVRLLFSGLSKIYKLLFCYLASDFLSTIGALWIPYNTKRYGDFYFSSQTLKILIAAFVVVEIYAIALENTPALAQFGRNTVGYLLGIAAMIPLIGLLVDRSSSAHPVLRAFLLFEQTMDATMAIFLIIISIFLAWFPVQMRRNVIVYIGGFIVWSLSRSAAVHLVNQWSANKQVSLAINTFDMCISVGCLLFWLIGLRREGEIRTAVVGHLWNRAETERLTEQLDAINNTLERLRRVVAGTKIG